MPGNGETPSTSHSPLRTAWAMTRPYFFARGAWAARALVAAIVALNVSEVWVQVILSDWNRRFFNAAQDLNRPAFVHEVRLFPLFVAPLICALTLERFLSETLRMRWRAWLSRQCLDLWLRDQAYYRLQWANGGADNPDQRISEDAAAFVDKTVSLSVSFLYSALGLFSFVAILWRLSGSADMKLPLVGAVHLPGYLVWGALAYAVVGTLVIHRVGKPLVPLGFAKERREADFRFALVRVRENAESIALYRGEPAERRILLGRFQEVLDNTWSLIRRRVGVESATMAYSNGATVVPWLLASARYFAGEVKMGDLMQATAAFSQVRGYLSVIVYNYGEIASWRATVERLAGFAAAVSAVRAAESTPRTTGSSLTGGPRSARDGLRVSLVSGGADGGAQGDGLAVIYRVIGDGSALRLSEVATHAPDGQAIGEPISLVVSPGERVLLGGVSGSGKTTLLRVIAGLWAFGSGTVTVPAVTTLVLSQKPYLPLGSLRDAVCFPRPASDVADDDVLDALTRVGLGRLVPTRDLVADWSQILSLGEQQRVAFARTLLVRPGMLILDEATSALDGAAERSLYRLVTKELPEAIVLSVGHRDSLGEHHQRRVALVHSLAAAAPASSPFTPLHRTAC